MTYREHRKHVGGVTFDGNHFLDPPCAGAGARKDHRLRRLGSSSAAAAPTQLLGKTITASYTVSSQAKKPNGRTVTASKNTARTIFVSSAGRVFERISQQNNIGVSRQKENEPGATRLHFVGNKLVGDYAAISGALHVEINFDSSFQSCTLVVIPGREAGKSFKWKTLQGTDFEAIGSVAVSGQSCSVAAGNNL